MTFADNLRSNRKEKHTLVVVSPRKRLTGFTLFAANVYRVYFDRHVSRAWDSFVGGEYAEGGSPSLTPGQFFYDTTNNFFYVYATTEPDLKTYPGVTVEFELYFASKYFIAHRVPTNASTTLVEWEPMLIAPPQTQNGTRESLYGFLPLVQSALRISNAEGTLNELLHEISFNYAPVKSYILVDDEYSAVNTRQVFSGFSSGISVSETNEISIPTVDYNKFFDREFSYSNYYNTFLWPNLEPDAYVGQTGRGWFIRRVYGMVDGFRAVNLDYSASPTTSNNRRWGTQYYDPTIDNGNLVQTVDHTAANTASRTYFTTTPKYNVGDWIILTHNSIEYYTEVEAVNRAGLYIDHANIIRTIVAADTANRKFVARVIVEDENGQSWWLRPGIDYNTFLNAPSFTMGFLMANNWEAAIGFTSTPFDPSRHKMYVRVYGPRELDQYVDSTDVGAVVDNGGNRAQAVSLLYQAISDSGFNLNDIDINTFTTVGADSHALGIAIPATHDASNQPKYMDVISAVLYSMLWKLSFIDNNNDLKLGLVSVGPFVAAADYEMNETEHYNFSYAHDYSDIYSEFIFDYGVKEQSDSNLTDLYPTSTSNAMEAPTDLHFVIKTYRGTLLQYDELEAEESTRRYTYALSDRRGYYSLNLGQEFLDKANLGASYQLFKEQLPGFPFVYGTEQERQLSVIEVQKTSLGVTITLEDQKAIQDNSGAW